MARAVLTLAIVGVTIYALVDCLRAPDRYVRGPKVAWVLAIIILPLLGALLYLFAGRELVGRGRRDVLPGRSRTIAPDDDPDFLRSLDEHPKKTPPEDEPQA